jgi:hypothetical protein
MTVPKDSAIAAELKTSHFYVHLISTVPVINTGATRDFWLEIFL